MDILFLHGKESGPNGHKCTELKKHFGPRVVAPDCTGVDDVEQRINIVMDHIPPIEKGSKKVLLVGSSLGGLVSVLIAHRYPQSVSGLVLCAPAVFPDWVGEIDHISCPTVILHGINDDIVPVEVSERFCSKLGRHILVEVRDGHRLSHNTDQLIHLVHLMLRKTEAQHLKPHTS